MAGKDASEAEKITRQAVAHAKQPLRKTAGMYILQVQSDLRPVQSKPIAAVSISVFANEAVRDAHERIINALAEEGVDFLCIETMFSAKEAAIAVDIARKTGLPIAVNMTYKYTMDRRTKKVIYKTDWGHSAVSLVEIPIAKGNSPTETTYSIMSDLRIKLWRRIKA